MEIGFQEMVLIGLVLVVFFGPKKLPELGEGLAKGIKEFKRALRDTTSGIREQAAAGDSVPATAASSANPIVHEPGLQETSSAHSDRAGAETPISH